MSNSLSFRVLSTAVASAALALTVALGAGGAHTVLHDGADTKTPLTLKDGHWCC